MKHEHSKCTGMVAGWALVRRHGCEGVPMLGSDSTARQQTHLTLPQCAQRSCPPLGAPAGAQKPAWRPWHAAARQQWLSATPPQCCAPGGLESCLDSTPAAASQLCSCGQLCSTTDCCQEQATCGLVQGPHHSSMLLVTWRPIGNTLDLHAQQGKQPVCM